MIRKPLVRADPNHFVAGWTETIHRDAITLRFRLPDARPATLRLLDLAGRTVRTSSASDAGEHVARFDDAAALPPGLYLAQLRQGAEQRTVRVVLTR